MEDVNNNFELIKTFWMKVVQNRNLPCKACLSCTVLGYTVIFHILVYRFITVTIGSHNTDDVLYSLYVSTFNRECNF